MDQDISATLAEQVKQAAAENTPLKLIGSRSKDFYGRHGAGAPLSLAGHSGILNYEPTELVLTARCGTPLAEIEAALAEKGQMLPFEPPRFGAGGTLGGAVASGLAGPRRPWGGAPRDTLLGVKLMNGKGETLDFGGQVMKNVAGYDVSRLMAGAMGCLGILLELSVKVLPRPEREWTLSLELPATQALETMNRLQARPVPLSAACHLNGRLMLRLAGSEANARQLLAELGGELEENPAFWRQLRDQTLTFYDREAPLWRVSMAPAAPRPEGGLIDWGGALSWYHDETDQPRQLAKSNGGHASLFRGGDGKSEVFQHPGQTEMMLHQRLKSVFDPKGIFNPGRLYADL